MAVTKIITRKTSVTSKRDTDGQTQFRQGVQHAPTKKTTH